MKKSLETAVEDYQQMVVHDHENVVVELAPEHSAVDGHEKVVVD